jgi:hypothetical protein
MQALSCMFRSSRLVCKRHIAGALLRRRRSRQLWRSSLRRWLRWRVWVVHRHQRLQGLQRQRLLRPPSRLRCLRHRRLQGLQRQRLLRRPSRLRLRCSRQSCTIDRDQISALAFVHKRVSMLMPMCMCLRRHVKALEGSIGGSWCGDCGRRRVCYSVEQPIAGVVSSQATADAPTRVLFRDHTV